MSTGGAPSHRVNPSQNITDQARRLHPEGMPNGLRGRPADRVPGTNGARPVKRRPLSMSCSQAQRVQVVTLDLVDPAEQRVEVVGDAEMAAGQAVCAAAGQREDQAGSLLRVGAAPGGELVAD